MGSAREIGKNKWQLRVYAHGRPWSKTVVATSRRRANELQADYEKEIRGDGDGTLRLGTVLEKVLAEGKTKWSPTTYDARESYARLHITPALGDLEIRVITAEVIDDFYIGLLDKLKPASVDKVHVLLSLVFKRAKRLGWNGTSPLPGKGDKPYSVKAPDIEPPSDAEVKKLLAAANAEFRSYLALADATGSRRGEQCGLQWKHIDLKTGTLTIAQGAIVAKGRGVLIKETKTDRRRTIALAPATVKTLKAHRRECEKRAASVGIELEPDTFVFENFRTGLPVRPDSMTTKFMRLREKTGATFRLHDLRHGHVTRLLAAGVDPVTVRDRVGHTSIASQNRYAHFVPAKDREAAKLAARGG